MAHRLGDVTKETERAHLFWQNQSLKQSCLTSSLATNPLNYRRKYLTYFITNVPRVGVRHGMPRSKSVGH